MSMCRDGRRIFPDACREQTEKGLSQWRTERQAQMRPAMNAMAEDAQEGIDAFLQERPPCLDGNEVALGAELPMQPGARETPFPLDGRVRDIQHFGGFFDRQAAKEPQLDYAAVPFIQLR